MAETAASPAQANTRAAVLDETKITALKSVAEREPANAKPRIDLGNLYFDAERYADAITWYEAALKLSPKDVNLSTDLGVCYYYTNQPDKAPAQFDVARDRSQTPKTLLNVGIVVRWQAGSCRSDQGLGQVLLSIRTARRPGRQTRAFTLDRPTAANKPGVIVLGFVLTSFRIRGASGVEAGPRVHGWLHRATQARRKGRSRAPICPRSCCGASSSQMPHPRSRTLPPGVLLLRRVPR